MTIRFTRHALEKFEILKRHQFVISRHSVLDAVINPDIVDDSRRPLKIAQKILDKNHVLRVVYRDERNEKVIITFYPGRRKQYEKE